MKTFILVRHAKSNWDNPDLDDIDRPLNKRGLRDAPNMGKLLAEKGIKPDLIISSPAERAFTTAEFFAEALDYPLENIRIEKLIYFAGFQEITRMLSELADSVSTVILFGHNPDITLLANVLSIAKIGNMPTCGIVCIDFKMEKWQQISEKKGILRFFEEPKRHD